MVSRLPPAEASSIGAFCVVSKRASSYTGAAGTYLDAGESVSFSEDLSTGGDLEGVPSVVLPEVVDCVQQSVASDLRGAAGRAMDVVVLESNLVLTSCEVQSPVLVSASGGSVL